MRSSTLPKIFGILAAAVLIGGLIGWLASRNATVAPPTPEPTVPVVTAPMVEPAPVEKPVAPVAKVETVIPAPEVAVNTNAFDPAQWDEKLDEILGDADDDTDRKARQLLDMMDKVDVDTQTEIAGHIVNLVSDDDFTKRAAKYLTNANVPEAVSSIFMNDLYNRDEALKLPLLLSMASNDKHPLKDEAKDLLELYVEEDYGTNWAKWGEATTNYLKEHASEDDSQPAVPTNP